MSLGITVDFNANLAKFSGQMDQMATKLDKFQRDAETMSNRVSSAFAALGGGLSFGILAKDILDTNRSMEALRAQLESVTGSAENGARSFQFIQKFATDTPFEIDGLTKAFVSLKNLGINPTQEVMSALTNQAAKLGGSQETLSAIVLQLGQAYSKGKLQQEDMVILAERGVPIYELAAQALNKTGAEIAEMSSKGQMGRDAIDAIIKKMGELSTGANARAMDTLNGQISNLSDSWHRFEDTLLNDKSEGYIKKSVELSSQWLNRLTQGMSSNIDDQIAVLEDKIKSRDFGAIGKAVYTFTNPIDSQQDQRGKDANDRELKRLKAFKLEIDKKIKTQRLKATVQQRSTKPTDG